MTPANFKLKAAILYLVAVKCDEELVNSHCIPLIAATGECMDCDRQCILVPRKLHSHPYFMIVKGNPAINYSYAISLINVTPVYSLHQELVGCPLSFSRMFRICKSDLSIQSTMCYHLFACGVSQSRALERALFGGRQYRNGHGKRA
jgi:hypothetical protein